MLGFVMVNDNDVVPLFAMLPAPKDLTILGGRARGVAMPKGPRPTGIVAVTVATNTVTATIPVGRGPFGIATPRALPPSIVKSFGAGSIANNGTTSLSFTITNPNITLQLTGIAFTDSLPSGLVVATPNGLSNSCSGVVSAVSGSSSVSLSGMTLAA